MIIPIRVNHNHIEPVHIDDKILLVNEKNRYDDNIFAAYNSTGQKIGYISAKSSSNQKVNNKMVLADFIGKVWCIAKNQILIQLD
jgi:hypothetical protein